MKTFVAYYRVSTQKQGQSGLGLEAQQNSVRTFANGTGEILFEFTEVESGKKNNRVELQNAIEKAKETNSTLIIAKLDRLSRNAAFIFALRDSGVDFICADMPDANTLSIGIFATLAQHERELISQRTKEALQAKKARGETLGTAANLTNVARENSLKVRKINSETSIANKQATLMALSLKQNGFSNYRIAQILNENGYKTRFNKSFQPATVRYLLNK